jgi:hypothetical protein
VTSSSPSECPIIEPLSQPPGQVDAATDSAHCDVSLPPASTSDSDDNLTSTYIETPTEHIIPATPPIRKEPNESGEKTSSSGGYIDKTVEYMSRFLEQHIKESEPLNARIQQLLLTPVKNNYWRSLEEGIDFGRGQDASLKETAAKLNVNKVGPRLFLLFLAVLA